MTGQTFLRFPSKARLALAITVHAVSGDDRRTCERHLRANFANYYGAPPETGIGMELESLLDLIEAERAATPARKDRTPESYRYANRRRAKR